MPAHLLDKARAGVCRCTVHGSHTIRSRWLPHWTAPTATVAPFAVGSQGPRIPGHASAPTRRFGRWHQQWPKAGTSLHNVLASERLSGSKIWAELVVHQRLMVGSRHVGRWVAGSGSVPGHPALGRRRQSFPRQHGDKHRPRYLAKLGSVPGRVLKGRCRVAGQQPSEESDYLRT